MADSSLLTSRQAALLEGAAQWRDPLSSVRRRAREAMRDGEWPLEVVEVALGSVLGDADQVLAATRASDAALSVLVILPGNILGPAISCAYCAAAAGANLMLKSSSRELQLADLVADQFEELGPPIAGTLRPMRWSGGDADLEAKVFPLARRIVVFGADETIADVRRRTPEGVEVVAYGSAYSLGFVPLDCDLALASRAAALDVGLFDQRGCLSPQTIYVQGDESRCILFARALSLALGDLRSTLPRARAGEAERAAVAEFVRRIGVRALSPVTHALGTVFEGPKTEGSPEYVVGAEPFGDPVCAGFGRLVVVKPCTGPEAAASAAATLGPRLDTIGVAGSVTAPLRRAFLDAGALRVCPLGEMQRPPFGYRPRIADFVEDVV